MHAKSYSKYIFMKRAFCSFYGVIVALSSSLWALNLGNSAFQQNTDNFIFLRFIFLSGDRSFLSF